MTDDGNVGTVTAAAAHNRTVFEAWLRLHPEAGAALCQAAHDVDEFDRVHARCWHSAMFVADTLLALAAASEFRN